MHRKNPDRLANSADPDQTAPKEQSDLGLHCLPTHFCPNSYCDYDNTAPLSYSTPEYIKISYQLKSTLKFYIKVRANTINYHSDVDCCEKPYKLC